MNFLINQAFKNLGDTVSPSFDSLNEKVNPPRDEQQIPFH